MAEEIVQWVHLHQGIELAIRGEGLLLTEYFLSLNTYPVEEESVGDICIVKQGEAVVGEYPRIEVRVLDS